MGNEDLDNYSYPGIVNKQALTLENIFSNVKSLRNIEKIDQLKLDIEKTFLLPHQMMYLICYNPRGIFFAKNVENFLPYKDNELTIEIIIKHISPLDIAFVTNAIHAIYEWCRGNYTSETDAVFTIEHRFIDKLNQTIYVQRNTKLLEVDENNLPVLALSIITNITSIIQNEFSPRASLYNPLTHEQYFYKEAQTQNPIWISKREQEVLDLLCKGFSSKQIAEQLFISKHTVDGHRRMLLDKSELSTTPELISFALKNNWAK